MDYRMRIDGLSKMVSLPDYIITEEICEYDHFKICRAQKIHGQRPVIIKTLKAGANQLDIAKIINEYEITRNLGISGIIKPIKLEWSGLTVALIVEDITVIPLKEYLHANQLDLPGFFSIAIQLTETLGELHQKGVIHRNLKPDAILVHPDTKQVTIADFSIATLMPRKDHPEFWPHTLAGTPAYMSPEQIGRMGKAIDHRSDFYSLGVVLYEILAGQLPFQASHQLQWIYAHIAQKPVNLRERNPDIPPALSAVIMKLLAKMAGKRYQNALGLLADLAECRRQWNQTGAIQPFILGRVDLSGRFQLPNKLYCREREIKVLTDAFESVRLGRAGLVLVYGYAGTGKTVLIQEGFRPLAIKKGYLITGKSDQLQQNIPYAPFIQAFRDLMRQFLTESQESLVAWKEKLLRALGRNGAVITQVIPEVELIIGTQPPAELLQPREAQNRFRLVFRNFIRVFTQKEHPLVIFLDDLQWADSASLNLLQYLCEDPDSHYLFFIGAYRDNEVTGAHPLLFTLNELQKIKIPIQHISLAPLDQACTFQFVADTLHCLRGTGKSQLLAEMLYRKTGGNPFFLSQLLQSAYEKNLLRFNTNDRCLEWEPASIDEMPMTNDVINFMTDKLQRLPAETRNVLQLAACIGNTFDLKTLSLACEQTPGQTIANLRLAIIEGLVLPRNGFDHTYRLFCHVYKAINSETKYEFLHDRVQQAAYSLVPEEKKQEIHLQIGRLLLQNTAQNELDEKIFDIMDHLNRALDLFDYLAEKIKLAKYNLLAGQKAKASTAYGSALDYFNSGIALLPDNGWQEYYRLTYDLHLERAQCEYLCDHFDTANQLFNFLMDRAQTKMEKADICLIKMTLNLGIKKYHETLQLGIEALKLLGLNLPENPGKFAFIKEILLAKWHLRKRNLTNFTTLPEMTDPVKKKIIRLLIAQACAAAMVNSRLCMFIMLKVANISIKYGNTDFSPTGYINYRIFFGNVLGDYKTGHKFEQTALILIEKYDNSSAKCIFYFTAGLFASHWTNHGSTSVGYLQKAVDYGLESGELLFVWYSMTLIIETKYFLGVSLAELYEEGQRYYNFAKRVRLLNYQLLIANLIGLAGNLETLSNADYTEEDFQKCLQEDHTAIMTYHFSKIQLYYLYGDNAKALVLVEQTCQDFKIISGLLLAAEYIFYCSLVITASIDQLPKNQQKKYRKLLRENQQRMNKWSHSCPANFLHKYLLIAAEIARLNGEDNEAMTLYDQSIQSARENGYVQNEALANELAAKFYLVKGRDKVAQVYLADACSGYTKWGANRKVQNLAIQYPHLLAGTSIVDEELETIEILKKAYQVPDLADGGNNEATGKLELYTVVQAVQRVAEETNPAKLLKSVLDIAIENAGADKGYLILEKDEKLFIEAAKDNDPHSAATVTPLLLEKSVNLSQMMVRYVARTLEPVIVNDIEQAGIFTKDPYIIQSCSKSAVCLPLILQGIPVGALYLENSLLTGVFTPERVEVLRLLSSQIAYIQKLQAFLAEAAATVNATPLPLIETLTERELDVLRLIAAGMSNKEIALRLKLTVNTVKTHILNIYGKLQVSRRVQAVTRAKELKLIN
ncbi:helix-turn-helix transcriptional regulator [Sporomusa ovata]|uniref:Serine/threonine protein kinase PrkC, regulator of stationary phase n=1 Tax=Sporomusa ovata TaxID=2378 RepID=A0A0U1KTV7_9FIRM|nr:AAA family ATPase [Sporomusa ovata]CQR70675.1 Serine/threonine protein kinase PrkC, regulator of stationary phase [Sporomusa ovata]